MARPSPLPPAKVSAANTLKKKQQTEVKQQIPNFRRMDASTWKKGCASFGSDSAGIPARVSINASGSVHVREDITTK
jgi:hypothetical protein